MTDDLRDRLHYAAIAAYAKDRPDMDGEAIARALTRGATKAQLLAYAISDVEGLVDAIRRAWARQAEDRAARDRPQPEPEPDPEEQRRQAEQWAEYRARQAEYAAIKRARRAAGYELVLADPAGTYARYSVPADSNSIYASSHGGWGRWQEWHFAEFREWAGDRFAAWAEQARVVVGADGLDVREFDAAWHPGGSRAYWSERMRRLSEEAAQEWADHIRLETTRELLGTLFALGDGSSITWGEATIGQHEQRVEMLTKNATGVIETAARHEAAIRMIKDAGVTCLADLAEAPGDE